MSQKTTLRDIQHVVETSYPLPIAYLLYRYRCTKAIDVGSRHKLLVDMFELLIKFLTILHLQESIQNDSQFLNKLPQREKSLDFLKRPSLGGWVGLLRTLATLTQTGGANSQWSNAISKWFNESQSKESSSALAALEMVGQTRIRRHSRTPNAEIIDGMVTYRNKSIAHGAHLDGGELERRIPLLEEIVAYLLRSASFLSDMRLKYIENIAVAPNDKWNTETTLLHGCATEPKSDTLDIKLELHELYMFGAGGFADSTPVRLAPFMIWQTNEEAKSIEVFFYNDAWRTKLEYLSYNSGAFYYHKELVEQLRELVRFDLLPAEHDDTVGMMSEEERREKSEYYYKHGRHLANEGQYENAICQYEQSLVYERRADTFYEIARMQIQLDDPYEAIRHTIFNCLELAPDHVGAQELLASLDIEKPPHVPDDAAVLSGDTPKMSCAVATDIFTPARHRALSWLWWSCAVVLYYMVSALIEVKKGDYFFTPALILFCICVLLLVAGPALTRSLVCWIYYPLSLQLDGMRLDRFEKWYRSQLRFMYGNYQFRDGLVDFPGTIKKELWYWIGWILCTIALVTALIFSTNAAEQPFPILVKRIIDYTLPSFWVYPSARYVVCVTAFIFNYSQQPLKPMLTKINDEGMRSLGHLTMLNASLVSAGYGTYLILSWFSFNRDVNRAWNADGLGDVVIVLAIFVIVIIWSIGTPLMIRRACRRAKYMASLKYSAHIETAFNTFLQTPTEETQKEYQWLVDHQSVIRKIGVWPLSVMQTLTFVVGTNLFLTGLTLLYLLDRFELWSRIKWLW